MSLNVLLKYKKELNKNLITQLASVYVVDRLENKALWQSGQANCNMPGFLIFLQHIHPIKNNQFKYLKNKNSK